MAAAGAALGVLAAMTLPDMRRYVAMRTRRSNCLA